jgi:hypothetical protein
MIQSHITIECLYNAKPRAVRSGPGSKTMVILYCIRNTKVSSHEWKRVYGYFSFE